MKTMKLTARERETGAIAKRDTRHGILTAYRDGTVGLGMIARFRPRRLLEILLDAEVPRAEAEAVYRQALGALVSGDPTIRVDVEASAAGPSGGHHAKAQWRITGEGLGWAHTGARHPRLRPDEGIDHIGPSSRLYACREAVEIFERFRAGGYRVEIDAEIYASGAPSANPSR